MTNDQIKTIILTLKQAKITNKVLCQMAKRADNNLLSEVVDSEQIRLDQAISYLEQELEHNKAQLAKAIALPMSNKEY